MTALLAVLLTLDPATDAAAPEKPVKPLTYAQCNAKLNKLRITLPRNVTSTQRDLFLKDARQKIADTVDGQTLTLTYRLADVTYRDGVATLTMEAANRGTPLSPRYSLASSILRFLKVPMTPEQAATLQRGDRLTLTAPITPEPAHQYRREIETQRTISYSVVNRTGIRYATVECITNGFTLERNRKPFIVVPPLPESPDGVPDTLKGNGFF